VLIKLDSELRRHRRKVLWALALFAVLGVAVTAKAALMSGHEHGDMSDAVVLCMTVGACVAVAGVAVFAARRLAQRPMWLIASPVAAALASVPVSPGFLVRAGPPPLLQVFRL
jgi:hypothetical protein